MALSDQELVEKVKAGDKEAFTELFDRYSGKILGYLFRYIGNYQTAEDLTVETFLNAYNNLPAYEERGTFSSWLYRIATNCAKMEVRKRLVRKETSLEEPVDEPEGLKLGDMIPDETSRPDYEARQKEFKEYIYRFVNKLGKKYKDAFLLCDVEGMGYEQAAGVLGSNAKTIGTRLRRARKVLYNIMKKYGYDL